MDDHRPPGNVPGALPTAARLSLNHCNLPPALLGSLAFQRHPVPLHLDGVEAFHHALFDSLEPIADPRLRAERFKDYMRSGFLLDHLDEAGLDPGRRRRRRDKADYLRMLRGWLFDPDGIEAAVLKSWVESRFGLLPRNHGGPLGDFGSASYRAYLVARSRGLYNTNALEAQIDLLYTYCQYEIRRQMPSRTHLGLYRGINRIGDHEILFRPDKHSCILVLNNLNSFTANRERACEIGDYIVETLVPLTKILFMPGLLPDTLKGEEEYLVIGGVYEVSWYLF